MEYIHGNGDGLVIIKVFSECFKLLFESLAIGENGGSKIYFEKNTVKLYFLIVEHLFGTFYKGEKVY